MKSREQIREQLYRRIVSEKIQELLTVMSPKEPMEFGTLGYMEKLEHAERVIHNELAAVGFLGEDVTDDDEALKLI